MDVLKILTLTLLSWVATGATDNIEKELEGNSSDINKDMYVIHAMVYQVGIITNTTDDDIANVNNTGNQESITIYHSNGSNIDLDNIPPPLLTNITARRLVGVAPTTKNIDLSQNNLRWSALDDITALPQSDAESLPPRSPRDLITDPEEDYYDDANYQTNPILRLFKRSLKHTQDASNTTVRIEEGTALIPKEVGLQSLVMPPLLALNNNMSEIPVPIPNTSIVHYSKINTLVQAPTTQ